MKLLGDTETDLERASPPLTPEQGLKGKEKATDIATVPSTGHRELQGQEKTGWYGLDPLPEVQDGDEKKGWWKAWDVSADCKEIGGMECYGQSLAFCLTSLFIIVDRR